MQEAALLQPNDQADEKWSFERARSVAEFGPAADMVERLTKRPITKLVEAPQSFSRRKPVCVLQCLIHGIELGFSSAGDFRSVDPGYDWGCHWRLAKKSREDCRA